MKSSWLVCAFLSSLSFGQMNTDRPSYSFGSQTIGKGELQIETGLSYNTNSQGRSFVQAPSTTLRLALGNSIELRMQNVLEFRKSAFNGVQSGIGNFELGCKIQAFRRAKTNIAVVLQGILPTATGYEMSPMNGGKAVLSITQAVSENGTLGSNIGYELSGVLDDVLTNNAHYTLIYVHELNPYLNLFAEVFHSFPNLAQFDKEAMVFNFDAGFTYALGRNVQLDYSFGFGILDRSNFQAIGFSYKFRQPLQQRMY